MNQQPTMRVELRAVDECASFLPRRRRAPHFLPANVPLPRKGEVIYLTSTSAWGVLRVVHEWLALDTLHVVIWMQFLGPTHHGARADFSPTQ